MLDPSVLFYEYELVILRPDHFLPDDSLLPCYSRRQDHRVQGMHLYKMTDRMLRRFKTNGERFPPFQFKGLRPFLGQVINPYLVILAAEIKFRRYLAASGPELPQDYKSLVDKTIEVAELLYFQPVGPPATFYLPVDMAMFHTEAKFNDVAMGFQSLAHDKFGVGGSTPRQARQPATGGGETRHADTDHWRYMLSGHGRFQFFLLWASLLIPSN